MIETVTLETKATIDELVKFGMSETVAERILLEKLENVEYDADVLLDAVGRITVYCSSLPESEALQQRSRLYSLLNHKETRCNFGGLLQVGMKDIPDWLVQVTKELAEFVSELYKEVSQEDPLFQRLSSLISCKPFARKFHQLMSSFTEEEIETTFVVLETLKKMAETGDRTSILKTHCNLMSEVPREILEEITGSEVTGNVTKLSGRFASYLKSLNPKPFEPKVSSETSYVEAAAEDKAASEAITEPKAAAEPETTEVSLSSVLLSVTKLSKADLVALKAVVDRLAE